jgi:ribonuclease D
VAQALPVHVKKLNNKNQQHEAIIDILFALVRIRAEENLLNPSILASRHDLEALFAGDDSECILLHGWRFTMVGKELQQLLRGELQLKIDNDNVHFIG